MQNEAVVRLGGYLAQSDFGGIVKEEIGAKSVEYAMNHAAAFQRSGAKGAVEPVEAPAGGCDLTELGIAGMRPERRQSGGSFTDAVLRMLEAQAAGSVASTASTAAVEAAAGALSRALAAAEVSGPGVGPGRGVWGVSGASRARPGEVGPSPCTSWT